MLGLLAAPVSALLSYSIDCVTTRIRFSGRAVLEHLALAPRSLPNAVLGLGLRLFFSALPSWLNLRGGKWSLAITYVVVFTTFSLEAVSGGLYQVSMNLKETARVYGASWSLNRRRSRRGDESQRRHPQNLVQSESGLLRRVWPYPSRENSTQLLKFNTCVDYSATHGIEHHDSAVFGGGTEFDVRRRDNPQQHSTSVGEPRGPHR